MVSAVLHASTPPTYSTAVQHPSYFWKPQATSDLPPLARLVRVGRAWFPCSRNYRPAHCHIQVMMVIMMTKLLMIMTPLTFIFRCLSYILPVNILHSNSTVYLTIGQNFSYICNYCQTSFIVETEILETTTSMTLHGESNIFRSRHWWKVFCV